MWLGWLQAILNPCGCLGFLNELGDQLTHSFFVQNIPRPRAFSPIQYSGTMLQTRLLSQAAAIGSIQVRILDHYLQWAGMYPSTSIHTHHLFMDNLVIKIDETDR